MSSRASTSQLSHPLFRITREPQAKANIVLRVSLRENPSYAAIRSIKMYLNDAKEEVSNKLGGIRSIHIDTDKNHLIIETKIKLASNSEFRRKALRTFIGRLTPVVQQALELHNMFDPQRETITRSKLKNLKKEKYARRSTRYRPAPASRIPVPS